MASPITTHVLDTALGRPAANLAIVLWSRQRDDGTGDWAEVARGVTNDDGRIADLMEPGSLKAGDYRMVFETGAYLEATGREGFYPRVQIEFSIAAPDEHYHVPLLLSPYGYSTYRGS